MYDLRFMIFYTVRLRKISLIINDLCWGDILRF